MAYFDDVLSAASNYEKEISEYEDLMYELVTELNGDVAKQMIVTINISALKTLEARKLYIKRVISELREEI